MQALLETGHKRLVECTHDGLWGNGIPLYQPNCLNQQQWKRQGILGELLQDIRARHVEIARSLLPANPWFQRGPPNFGLSPNNLPVPTPGTYTRTALVPYPTTMMSTLHKVQPHTLWHHRHQMVMLNQYQQCKEQPTLVPKLQI